MLLFFIQGVIPDALVMKVAVWVLSLAVLSPAVVPLVDTRFASWSLRHSTFVGNKKGSA